MLSVMQDATPKAGLIGVQARIQKPSFPVEVSRQDAGARRSDHRRHARGGRARFLVENARVRGTALEPREMMPAVFLLALDARQPVIDHRAIARIHAFSSTHKPKPDIIRATNHRGQDTGGAEAPPPQRLRQGGSLLAKKQLLLQKI